jgi:3-phosphoshikimate 1-carboxyvinyltransferase
MIEIKPGPICNCRVTIPGSKSYTHRVLVAAALAKGESSILNGLKSEDTQLTIHALRQMGVEIVEDKDRWRVTGRGGRFAPRHEAIHLGNSGTSMRLVAALAVLGEGKYILNGTQRMHQRPIGKLLDGLTQAGAYARAVNQNACPPVVIDGQNMTGGRIELDCSDSSQYLSALLFIAPCTQNGMQIEVIHGPVSQPYIDMTITVMECFGINVKREEYSFFKVAGGQVYQPTEIIVEPDASNASYFWAAAAITRASITVEGVHSHSRQGDVGFAKVLQQMGCDVNKLHDGINVTGGKLKSIDVDMGHMPDLVPTLAVVAAFADGTTRIRNVGHLKVKESDRLNAVATELARMGIDVETGNSEITIRGGNLRGAVIDTYGDHRMAMSFAVAGLAAPGVFIRDETCVNKSFPSFWEIFETLYRTGK